MAQDELADRAPYPRFLGDGRIEFRELPVPRPGPGQLLLKVRANALCGTDRAQFLGGSAVAPGHEAAGVVVAAGAGTHTAAGTPGVVYLMEFCGNCRSCRRDATNQCLAKRADMGFDRDGGYGPYELISESIFFSVEASLPLTEATLLLDLMGTSGHALDRALAVRSDIESTLITGAGPVGLGLLAMARLRFGADAPVVVTDLVPYRRSLAQRLGGIPLDGALELRTELARVGIADVDLAIDSTGRPGVRESAVAALGKRGVLVCVGHGDLLTFDVSRDLIAPERAVLGSEYFPYADLERNLGLLREHRRELGQVITHRFPVSRLDDAFETFWSGQSGKVVVEQ